MKSNNIHLNSPYIRGNEKIYVQECLESEWLSKGKFNEEFEKKVADFTNSKHAIGCINGTSALQIALKIAGVKPQDEVVVPTITFIAPINAIKYNGANPIFMDVDEFHNIDIKKTISFLKNETFFKSGFTYNKITSKKISAIIPVHTWGNAVNFDELYSLCEEKKIMIIEDASESLGTNYKDGQFSQKHTGTIGLIGCLSFNANKIITTGGGGMILTSNDAIALKAKYFINQAKDDSIWYKHNEIGYNYRLSNVNAAIGVAQIEQLNHFLDKKRKIHKMYLKKFNQIKGLSIMEAPNYCNSNYWLNVLKIDSRLNFKLKKIINDFNKSGIQIRPIWFPNHLQKPYINCQSYKIEEALRIVDNSLCLPSSVYLEERDINLIINYFIN